MAVHEPLSAPFYEGARTVLGAAARIYFRRIEVRDRERIPRAGPLLVVANHPASFTDVIVLGAAVPRRLHFLAMAPIFKPWIRGFALRLCGTLPVYRRSDDPALVHRNDDTFRVCHEFLDSGGAVLIFPEGTSLTDRQIVPLKTGAARLALGQEARPGQQGRLTLLPIGLHFAERSRYASDVAVSVGPPIDLAPFLKLAESDEVQAVRQLTAHIQEALEGLILNVPAVDRVRWFTPSRRSTAASWEHPRSRWNWISFAAWPSASSTSRARTRSASRWPGSGSARTRANLESLKLRDQAVREMLPAPGRVRERLRLVAMGLLGLLPAVAGGLIQDESPGSKRPLGFPPTAGHDQEDGPRQYTNDAQDRGNGDRLLLLHRHFQGADFYTVLVLDVRETAVDETSQPQHD